MHGRRPRTLSGDIKIFGTDIDSNAIAIARTGRYRQPVAGVSPERLERWFVKEGDHFCLRREIRELCAFSVHSIVKDPPFSRLDLISCRNVLIYLDTELQDRVIQTFHYALNPGGFLFLGTSESITRHAKHFAIVDEKHHIFQQRDYGELLLPLSRPSAAALLPVSYPGATRADEDRIDRECATRDGAIRSGLFRDRQATPDPALFRKRGAALSRALARGRQPEPV